MNWTNFALDLPQIVGVAVNAVQKIKSAKGPEKEAAVLDTVKQAAPIISRVTPININDQELDNVLKAYIAARVALMNVVTKKTAVPEGVMVPPQ